MCYPLLERFLKFKSIEVRSSSIDAYKNDITKFYEYVGEKKFITEELDIIKGLEYNDIEDFIFDMIKKQMAVKTINRRIVSIKAFMGYIVDKQKIVSVNVADNVKVLKENNKNGKLKAKKIKYTPTMDEFKSIIESTKKEVFSDNGHRDFLSIRDRLIISLMASTGLRITSVLTIELDEIEKKGAYDIIIIPNEKHKNGNKIEEPLRVPVVGIVKDLLDEYIFERSQIKNHRETDYLFISSNGKQIRRDVMNNSLKKLLQKAEINKEITCHSFRSFFKQKAIGAEIQSDLINFIGGWCISGEVQQVYTKDSPELDEVKAKAILRILG